MEPVNSNQTKQTNAVLVVNAISTAPTNAAAAGRLKKTQIPTKRYSGSISQSIPPRPPPTNTWLVWVAGLLAVLQEVSGWLVWGSKQAADQKCGKLCARFSDEEYTDVCDRATQPRVYLGNPLSGSSLLWVGRNGIESILPRSALAIGFGSYCRWPKQGGSANDVVDGTKPSKVPSWKLSPLCKNYEDLLH